MNLIISLLGQKHKNLFNEKFIYNKVKKSSFFLLDEILDKFSFCNKIFIICKKSNIKKIKFKKISKIKIIYSNHTNNQINSILKVKNYIKNDEKIIILNPDSFFNIEALDFDTKSDGIIFNISKRDIGRNYQKKDTLYLDKKNNILKIEKKTKDLNKKIVSAGLYYLSNWKLILDSCLRIKNINKKNLQFVDIFLNLINDYNIGTKSVKNFICLEDKKKIKEYNFWKKYFTVNHKLRDNLKLKDIQNIIPSAGEGSRHKHLGYNVPKPLIPISKKMMFERSHESLPNNDNNLFIFNEDTFIKNNLKKYFPKKNKKSIFYLIKKKTKGMAVTISNARRVIQLDKPVLISSCDFKCVINYKKFYEVINKQNPSAMIFTWSQYPPASESPKSHAYVVDKRSIVKKISEKKTISSTPDKDNAVTGIFYFKTGRDLIKCIDHSIENKITVNGEYYIATAMTKLLNEKKKIINFKVDQMISWSLPEHLQDYLFWEKVFVNENNKI
jgi:NDP-sugar pyrophosphorylase family protein